MLQNDARLRYTIALILMTMTIAATSSVVAMAYCGSFTFSPLGNEDRTRHVERALARVYTPDATATDHHEGAATIIHIHPMLLVTASHVAKGNLAKINFPKLGNEFYEATVIARSNRSPLTLQTNEESENYDFAVLLVEHPPRAGVEALETWFEEIDKEKPHDLAGYARDMATPLWGRNGTLAQNTECAWRLRETTFNGDSGGAAVSQDGLLVGIIIDGREGGQFDDGAMGQATVLPLHCVRNTILSALDQAEPTKGSNVLDADRPDLMQELQPPASAGWIDNLRFARGLRDLIVDQLLLRKLRSQDAIDCPLFRSAIERKLGYETAVQLIKLASQNLKDEGDTLKRIGDEQKTENPPLARRLFASAATVYSEFIYIRGTAVALGSPLSPELAQAALGRVDVLTSLAKLTGDSATKTAAVTAAAYAVRATSPGHQRGFAYAILGNSAFEAGDYQTAIEAFSSASKSGFKAEWVQKDYTEAFRRRDNIIHPSSAKDYTTLGAYRPLSDIKVRELGRGIDPRF
jgi:hypothetical protein